MTAPRWLLETVDDADPDRPLVLLLRHAERGPLPADGPGTDVPIVAAGVAAARLFGQNIRSGLMTLHTSPVLRCVETAEAIREGARVAVAPTRDSTLGSPGVFVEDEGLAWRNWTELGNEAVMAAMIEGRQLPGMAPPQAAARRLIEHAVRTASWVGGVHIFVTHDSLLAATVAHTFGDSRAVAEWPSYLEGLALVPLERHVRARWRDRTRVICRAPTPPGPLGPDR